MNSTNTEIDYAFDINESWFWNANIENKFALDITYLRDLFAFDIYHKEKENVSLVRMLKTAKYSYPRLEELNDRCINWAFVILTNYWLIEVVNHKIDLRIMEAFSWALSYFLQIFPANGFIDKMNKAVYLLIFEYIKGKSRLSEEEHKELIKISLNTLGIKPRT
mgnify:CR=1 FL=1